MNPSSNLGNDLHKAVNTGYCAQWKLLAKCAEIILFYLLLLAVDGEKK